MSNDIATISLRVNTGDLERGNQALDKFQDTAAAAAGKADDLNSSFKAGASTQKQNTESLKQQRQELQNLLKLWMNWIPSRQTLRNFGVKGWWAMRITLATTACWRRLAQNWRRSWSPRPQRAGHELNRLRLRNVPLPLVKVLSLHWKNKPRQSVKPAPKCWN